MNKNVRILTESAIMLALASVLSMFQVYKMPLGGSITIASLLPIIIIAYRHGIKWGFVTAFAHSVLQLVIFGGLENIAYGTTMEARLAIIFVDYIIAFTALGTAAFFANIVKSNKKTARTINFSLGAVVALVIKFICHWLVGAVVWYGLTKDIWYADNTEHFVHKHGAWVYSFIYNIQYMLPELIITVVIGVVLVNLLDFKKDRIWEK